MAPCSAMASLSLLFLALVSTSLAQNFCVSGPTSSVDTSFQGVTLPGDSQGIQDPSAACPGFVGVRNLTNLIANLTIGKTYHLSYQVTTCGGVYSVRSGAWIDYNNNSVFDANEALFSFSNVYGFQNWTFTVPPAAIPGKARLRVQVQETSNTIIDPCASFSYGATTDYSVQLKPEAPEGYCDSGPTQGSDMNLGPVHLTGFTLTIDDTSDCPSHIGPKDLTYMVADVNPGATYNLNYQVTDCTPDTGAWPTVSGAWIDYNADGEFQSWELVAGKFHILSGVGSVQIPFTVPLTTTEQPVIPGQTTMRVQVQETNSETIDPCAHFAWGGTKDFTIRILEPKSYCGSGPTSTAATALGSVKLIGATMTIDDPATCSDAKTGPVDHTTMVADVYIATPYTITWSVITCSSQFQTMSAAWVDYNQNEILESWEQITPRSNAFGTISYAFKVPPSAPNQVVVGGPTRLRVQVQQTAANQTLDPCAMFTNGGTRDYTLSILSGTTTNAEEQDMSKIYGGRDHYSRIVETLN